jgi:protein phosphatase
VNVRIEIADPALVLLVGVAGCGKSTFARRHFAPTEILSSDRMRALVADDPADQSASGDAFTVLHLVLDCRLKRGLTTVVDATNIEWRARRPCLVRARRRGVGAIAIVLDPPLEVCRQRDAARTERHVGREILERQAEDLERTRQRFGDEGYEAIHVLDSADAIDAAEIVRVGVRRGSRPRA